MTIFKIPASLSDFGKTEIQRYEKHGIARALITDFLDLPKIVYVDGRYVGPIKDREISLGYDKAGLYAIINMAKVLETEPAWVNLDDLHEIKPVTRAWITQNRTRHGRRMLIAAAEDAKNIPEGYRKKGPAPKVIQVTGSQLELWVEEVTASTNGACVKRGFKYCLGNYTEESWHKHVIAARERAGTLYED